MNHRITEQAIKVLLMIQISKKNICRISQENQNLESDFHIFKIPDPTKSVLGPGDVFACFLYPQIHQFIYNFVNFL